MARGPVPPGMAEKNDTQSVMERNFRAMTKHLLADVLRAVIDRDTKKASIKFQMDVTLDETEETGGSGQFDVVFKASSSLQPAPLSLRGQVNGIAVVAAVNEGANQELARAAAQIAAAATRKKLRSEGLIPPDYGSLAEELRLAQCPREHANARRSAYAKLERHCSWCRRRLWPWTRYVTEPGVAYCLWRHCHPDHAAELRIGHGR